MWNRAFLAALLVAALASVSCNKDDVIEAAAGDPVPAGMAVLNTNAAAGVASAAVANLLSEAAVAASKPSPGLVIGAFPEGTNCAGGGTFNVTPTVDGTTPLPATQTATFAGCSDGTFTFSGTAQITIPITTAQATPGMRTCTEDTDEANPVHDVPSELTAVIQNGTVSASGISITLSNGFEIHIEEPVYDGAPDGPEDGGTCRLLDAHIDIEGSMTMDVGGETTTLGFGDATDHVTVAYDDTGTEIEMDISGPMSVDTLCTDGAYSFTLATTSVITVNRAGGGITGGVVTATRNGTLVATVPLAGDPNASPCSSIDL